MSDSSGSYSGYSTPLRGALRRFGAGELPCGGFAPFSAREYLRRTRRGRMRLRGAAFCVGAFATCCFGKQEAPARGGALNLVSSCAIGASALGHTMSLQCEGTPSWERGKNKIRTKIGISPSPKRVFPRAPFPLNPHPLCRFFLWSREVCPIVGYTWSNRVRTLCRYVA